LTSPLIKAKRNLVVLSAVVTVPPVHISSLLNIRFAIVVWTRIRAAVIHENFAFDEIVCRVLFETIVLVDEFDVTRLPNIFEIKALAS